MSRVDWDVTAGWLTRESIVSLPGSTAGGVRANSPFDQLLEQAQRTVGATSDYRPEPPLSSPSPRPPESPPRQDSRQSAREDRPASTRSEDAGADSQPPPPAENRPESSSPQATGDDGEPSDPRSRKPEVSEESGDDAKDGEPAPEAAAVAGAAASGAQAAPNGSHETPTQRRNATAGELVELAHGQGKAATSRSGTKKQAKTAENAKADATPDAAQQAKSQDATQIAAENAADAAGLSTGRVSAGEGDDAGQGAASDTPAPGQATVAVPVEPAAKTTGDGSTAGSAGATAGVQAIEAGVPDASPSSRANADAGPPVTDAARRGGSRGPRALGEAQAQPVEATTAAESVSPGNPIPAGSDTVDVGLSGADDGPAAPAGSRQADSSQDARTGDSAAVRDVSAKTSDSSGPQNEETAKSDAAERARFVQRVARAFESAADRAGHIRLRLHPPELGAMRLDLTVRDGHMSARLQTETEAARNMLMENLPALKERLAEHQIKVESFDIEWQGQPQGGFSQHSADQSRWQPPPTGYAARGAGGAQSASDAQTTGDIGRRISPNTSFDVVI